MSTRARLTRTAPVRTFLTGAVKKDLSVRVHHCSECGSTKPRDVASGQVIRNRGLSAVGLTVDEIACGRDLPGALPRQDW